MIQIQHLTKRFAAAGATVVALNDINLEIQDGDIYGIIGMSGAGKSTLVRCINMLERPDEGKVIVNGREMMQLSPRRAARCPAGDHDDLPAVQPADAAHLPEEHLLPHGAGRCAQRESHSPRQGAAGAGWPAGQGGRLPGAAFRRAKAAHCHCACPGHQPQGVAV